MLGCVTRCRICPVTESIKYATTVESSGDAAPDKPPDLGVTVATKIIFLLLKVYFYHGESRVTHKPNSICLELLSCHNHISDISILAASTKQRNILIIALAIIDLLK
jgi:hypothetical protein